MIKKKKLFAVVAVSVFALAGASVWEGAAAVGENLPENGYFIATNSFPVNTLVEVVNLENNRSATVIVSSSLNNSGLLALLSKDAADSIGLNNSGRIRMKEKDDQAAYYGSGGNTGLEGHDLALIPAENRPPEDLREPYPDNFVSSIPLVIAPSIKTPHEIYESPIVKVVSAVPGLAVPPPAPVNSTAAPRFSAPLIQNFERGMYYVQIGTYEKVQTVESEVLKVERNLPVAVMQTTMKTGNTEKLVYRVLIGPLKPGESGAVFQRYKAIYKDAFLRVGN
jgi:hypothetical protein